MTPRALIWSPEAISDLREIADYIALDKPKAARRWSPRGLGLEIVGVKRSSRAVSTRSVLARGSSQS